MIIHHRLMAFIILLIELFSLISVKCENNGSILAEVDFTQDNENGRLSLETIIDVDELLNRKENFSEPIDGNIPKSEDSPEVDDADSEVVEEIISAENNIFISNDSNILESANYSIISSGKSDAITFQEIIYSIHFNKAAQDITEIMTSTLDINRLYNVTKLANATNPKQSNCIVLDRDEILDVEVLNDTSLNLILSNNPNITSRSLPANCYLIYFYSPYCPFSTQGSAYVNALARALKNIPVYGLNSIQDHGVNARYGVMGTPSFFLFHNGNVAGRYNASDFSTSQLENFINYYTNQKIYAINVTSADFKSNLPSIVSEPSSAPLYAAWLFLIGCGSWMFFTSKIYKKLIETFLNNWREAEAHHAHQD